MTMTMTMRQIMLMRPLLLPQRMRMATSSLARAHHPKQKKASLSTTKNKAAVEERLKRRTRSGAELDLDLLCRYTDASARPHVPVLLAEVLQAFRPLPLRSFVDCTLGAAGHSSAIIEDHEEMELYVGMDVDPEAHDMAQARINTLLEKRKDNCSLTAYTHVRNFKYIKLVLGSIDENLLCNNSGVDGILIDLGMSSMQVDSAKRGFSVLNDGPLDMRMDPQATLKAEDILNSWPEQEVGRILREYGEESNWRSLQNHIVRARASGGLHSTAQLVQLIRKTTNFTAGRQGWIKTATRVFQALRIAVNNELQNLEDSLYSCFDCLGPGRRLAVISFHSLEDRIVKQTFLDLINGDREEDDDNDHVDEKRYNSNNNSNENEKMEAWCKHKVQGRNGTVLTKRPITPSMEEERLNPRCRSAKLRVIQKGTS